MLANQINVECSNEERIDRFLAHLYPQFSRTYFKKMVSARTILVDGHPVTPHHLLKRGQLITIDWPSHRPRLSAKQFGPLPFPVIFEDEELLVIDKPAGLLCHPAGARGRGESIVDLLAHKLSQQGWPDDLRPGLVHRLDKDTSGLLIFTKNPDSHARIAKQFQSRQVKKTYLALAGGIIEANSGSLEGKLARNPLRRNQFSVSSEGRYSLTHFNVIERLHKGATLVELNPVTGRTHQLRVQLSAYGHPIVGDALYGGRTLCGGAIKRQMLHAHKIGFFHPESNEKLFFESPLPPDFQAALKLLR